MSPLSITAYLHQAKAKAKKNTEKTTNIKQKIRFGSV